MSNEASILIVDDEEDLTQLIGEILEKYNYSVKKAHTGYDALQMLNFQPYDLVILDLIMPTLGGLETLEKIKRIDSGLPVIILTAMIGLIRLLKR
ncbi:response regulator [candidate division KSB1 bacterium]|nr:response regulator [candidate division KSB1 bacterium]